MLEQSFLECLGGFGKYWLGVWERFLGTWVGSMGGGGGRGKVEVEVGVGVEVGGGVRNRRKGGEFRVIVIVHWVQGVGMIGSLGEIG